MGWSTYDRRVCRSIRRREATISSRDSQSSRDFHFCLANVPFFGPRRERSGSLARWPRRSSRAASTCSSCSATRIPRCPSRRRRPGRSGRPTRSRHTTSGGEANGRLIRRWRRTLWSPTRCLRRRVPTACTRASASGATPCTTRATPRPRTPRDAAGTTPARLCSTRETRAGRAAGRRATTSRSSWTSRDARRGGTRSVNPRNRRRQTPRRAAPTPRRPRSRRASPATRRRHAAGRVAIGHPRRRAVEERRLQSVPLRFLLRRPRGERRGAGGVRARARPGGTAGDGSIHRRLGKRKKTERGCRPAPRADVPQRRVRREIHRSRKHRRFVQVSPRTAHLPRAEEGVGVLRPDALGLRRVPEDTDVRRREALREPGERGGGSRRRGRDRAPL